MSAPGWYPDPRGGGGRRYWDGVRWSDHVQAPGQYPQNQSQSPQQYPQQPNPYGRQQPGQQYGQQQYGQVPPGAGDDAPRGGSTLALWVTLAVSVALIIGLGSWLLFFRDADPETSTSPSPSITETAADPTTPEPDPSTPAPQPTDDPATTVIKGDPLTPLQCEGTADDARGEANAQDRYESTLGLSFPAIPGFTGRPIQYPWVWGANSQFKDYGNGWMATATVGHLRLEDGFSSHEQAAVRLAQCMLSSEFYGDHFVAATVFAVESQADNAVTWLDIDVDVAGVEGVNRDWVTIVTAERGDELHVGITVVPDSSEADYDLVQDAFADLLFS